LSIISETYNKGEMMDKNEKQNHVEALKRQIEEVLKRILAGGQGPAPFIVQ